MQHFRGSNAADPKMGLGSVRLFNFWTQTGRIIRRQLDFGAFEVAHWAHFTRAGNYRSSERPGFPPIPLRNPAQKCHGSMHSSGWRSSFLRDIPGAAKISFLTGQTAPKPDRQEQLQLAGGFGDSQRKLQRMELFVCCCLWGCRGDYTDGSVGGRKKIKKKKNWNYLILTTWLREIQDSSRLHPRAWEYGQENLGLGKGILQSIRSHSEAPGDASSPLCCYLAALHQAGSREIPNISMDWDLLGHVAH